MSNNQISYNKLYNVPLHFSLHCQVSVTCKKLGLSEQEIIYKLFLFEY